MNHPSRKSALIGVVGGIVSGVVLGILLSYFEYHIIISSTDLWILLVGAFVLGFISVGFSSHTGLIAPGGGFIILLLTIVTTELTTPSPQKVGELGENTIVDGSFHTLSYAETWYMWLTLLLVAGIAEFAIRCGYGYHADRLRNLPELPLSRTELGIVVSGCSVMVGLAAMIVLIQGELWDTLPGYGIGFVAAAAATAVPLAVLLSRGIVSPFILYGWLITSALHTEIFTAPDSGLHIPILGIGALVFAIVAALEILIRFRLLGWDGGKFVINTN